MSNIDLSVPLPNKLKFVDYRQEIWGDSFNWAWTRKLSEVKKLVIHHAVTNRDTTTPDDIALLHKANGWKGIGYHFVITGNGTVYYVGDIGTARANVGNNNEKVIGICLTGDFTKELPTQEQMAATKALCEFFMKQYPALTGIRTWKDVWGHKECTAWAGTKPTACPGSNWNTEGDSLYARLRDGHFDGYPWHTPPVEPTPEEKLNKVISMLKKGTTIESLKKYLKI